LGLNANQTLPQRKTPFFRGAKDDNAATDPNFVEALKELGRVAAQRR
jgi:hypothetical protein